MEGFSADHSGGSVEQKEAMGLREKHLKKIF